MSGYPSSLKRSIENRINNGTLKVADSSGAKNTGKQVKASTNSSIEKLQALGRLKAGKMNKTELAYAQYLDALKACGEVSWWSFESVKLRLADATYYTVDFMVMRSTGELEAHEIKGGYAFEDSLVKLKVANEMFPWSFFLVKKGKNGTWNIKKVGNKDT